LQTKQFIRDEFLVENYKNKILPYLSLSEEKSKVLEDALNNFIRSKGDYVKEVDSVFDFYSKLNSLLHPLERLGISKQKAEKLLILLKELQSILFQIPQYRDHLSHQLRVYLLGCYILSENKDFFIKITSKRYAQIICEIIGEEEGKREALYSLFYSILYNTHLYYNAWSVAGLYHDIGYPIEGLLRILHELINKYGSLRPLLKIEISLPTLIPAEDLNTQINSFKDSIRFLFHNMGELESLLELEKSMDHDIWGAFFLTPPDIAKNLKEKIERVFQNLRIWELLSSRSVFTMEDFASILCIDAVIAIAVHSKPYFIYLSPLTFLLIVSDTLQEWSRIGYINFKEFYLPRYVFLQFKDNLRGKVIESEIYIFDSSPQDFYKKISEKFRLPRDISNIEKLRSMFLRDFKFIVKVGPPFDEHTTFIV
jgi:hypothetical protein